jgi:hypothetical protein
VEPGGLGAEMLGLGIWDRPVGGGWCGPWDRLEGVRPRPVGRVVDRDQLGGWLIVTSWAGCDLGQLGGL